MTRGCEEAHELRIQTWHPAAMDSIVPGGPGLKRLRKNENSSKECPSAAKADGDTVPLSARLEEPACADTELRAVGEFDVR
jgi:hypothetical protein